MGKKISWGQMILQLVSWFRQFHLTWSLTPFEGFQGWKGPLEHYFLNATLFDFLSSICDLFSKAIIIFSTDNAYFMFSTRVTLLALSTKIAILEGREDMYHSICISTAGLEVVGILFSNLLNLELKSLILSSELDFRLERSLIKDTTVLSSPNFARNISSKVSEIPGSCRSLESIRKQSNNKIFMCNSIKIHG